MPHKLPELAGAQILIVDDDIRNIYSLTSVLESYDVEVLHAERGRDGILILEQTPGVDVDLIDIMMPEMDGYDTMQQIRANPDQTDHYNKRKSERSRKVKGLVLFSGYTGGPREWKGGEIYDPKSGDTGRNGKIKLVSDNALEVKGCLGPICRTKHWTRVK